MKRTNLKKVRVKSGIYLIPVKNPRKPSKDEIQAFEQINGLIKDFGVRAIYFVVTQVEPEEVLDGIPPDWEHYFVLAPIRIKRE